MVTDPALDALRSQIDAIDDRMHDLLMQRTEIVARIGDVKRDGNTAGFALRPGREAGIIRRLVARHRGPFPVAAVVRLWRELLSAQVGVQSAFSVAVFAPDKLSPCRDLARDQFGGCTPLRRYRALDRVIAAVAGGEAAIGVLPAPPGEGLDPWWRALASTHDGAPRVIARLPFITCPSCAPAPAEALAIARLAPESTGDDISLLAVELAAPMSRDRLRRLLGDSGLRCDWLDVWQDPNDRAHALHLIAIESYWTGEEPELATFRDKAAGAVSRTFSIGAYARQLAADAGAPSA